MRLNKIGEKMKLSNKQKVLTLVSITVLFFSSGCADKNSTLKNKIFLSSKNTLKMHTVTDKPLYVIFKAEDSDVKIFSYQTTELKDKEIELINRYNERHKDTEKRLGCVKISKTIEQCNGNFSVENSFFSEREIKKQGDTVGAIIGLPIAILIDGMSATTSVLGGEIPKESFVADRYAPKTFNNELLYATGVYIDNMLYDFRAKTINSYKNSTTDEDKKIYEKEYVDKVSKSEIFNVQTLETKTKADSELDVKEGSLAIISGMFSDGRLKGKFKISLNPTSIASDIPIRYGTYKVKARFLLSMKHRVTAWFLSDIQEQKIEKDAIVTLSPQNNYTEYVDIDFGSYIQSAKVDAFILKGGVQLVDAKLKSEVLNWTESF